MDELRRLAAMRAGIGWEARRAVMAIHIALRTGNMMEVDRHLAALLALAEGLEQGPTNRPAGVPDLEELEKIKRLVELAQAALDDLRHQLDRIGDLTRRLMLG